MHILIYSSMCIMNSISGWHTHGIQFNKVASKRFFDFTLLYQFSLHENTCKNISLQGWCSQTSKDVWEPLAIVIKGSIKHNIVDFAITLSSPNSREILTYHTFWRTHIHHCNLEDHNTYLNSIEVFGRPHMHTYYSFAIYKFYFSMCYFPFS